MTSSVDSLGSRLLAATGRVAERVGDAEVSSLVTDLDDERLLSVIADAASARDALDVVLAAGAAEVARRSARDLGYQGLAQRKGHRNVTSLVQNITGQTRADVGRALRTGEDLLPVIPAEPVTPSGGSPDATPPAPVVPAVPRWRSLLRDALQEGRIGPAPFQAIRAGLGEPPVERYPDLDPEFLPAAWAAAVERLLTEASTLPVEELRNAARIARDRLDPVGVTIRFEERYQARSYRMWTDEHGQRQGRIAFDDDAAAWFDTIINSALRPRRGPRFVGPDAAERTETAAADERTNEQLQYDTLLAILRTGASADPNQAFGDRQPGVRIIVEATAIQNADQRGEMRVTGVGHLEDGGQALPGGLIESYLCNAGALPVQMDGFGRPLDLGREQRLFSKKQRIAIAARDGGCIWPSCTAPPSWCEYHHNDHWHEDHGKTDVDDGVPLCKNCHLRLHNQGWRISRERDPDTGIDIYWLHPPPDPDTGEILEPIRLHSKSPRRFTAA